MEVKPPPRSQHQICSKSRNLDEQTSGSGLKATGEVNYVKRGFVFRILLVLYRDVFIYFAQPFTKDLFCLIIFLLICSFGVELYFELGLLC